MSRVTRAQANVIRAFSIWTVYVWVTRIWNIWNDEARDGAFKAVHTIICVISIGFAIAAWVVVSQVRRRQLAKAASTASPDEHLDLTAGNSRS